MRDKNKNHKNSETTKFIFAILGILVQQDNFTTGNYMFKVNNRNTRTSCEICSKLTIKIPERHQASFWYLFC